MKRSTGNKRGETASPEKRKESALRAYFREWFRGKPRTEDEITFEDFKELIYKECYFCQRSETVNLRANRHHAVYKVNCLTTKDKKAGRTKENCVTCCKFCVHAKKTKRKSRTLDVADPNLAKEWHPTKNGNLTPDQITIVDKRKVWWLGKCGHEWLSSVRVRQSVKSGCHYCSSLTLSYEKSLEYLFPEESKIWNFEKNKGIKPSDVFGQSNKQYWWKGACGHEWQRTPSRQSNSAGCPFCDSLKNEKETYEILQQIFLDWTIIRGKMIWKSYKNYPHKRICDFLLTKNNARIMVEYDGKQHFEPIQFGSQSLDEANKAFDRQKLIHELDASFCKENNIALCRIPYYEDKRRTLMELYEKVGDGVQNSIL